METLLSAYETTAELRLRDSRWFASLKISLVNSLCRAKKMSLNSLWCLLFCKVIILVVSAYDIYLTVKYVEFLPQMELNPLGRWLMGLDRGTDCCLQHTAAFITAKFTGNVVVVVALELLASFGFRWVGIVAASVASFQFLLGCYLYFAEG